MPKAKQPSRKSKAAWRKNIDLDAVEKSLEKQRAVERIGEEQVHPGTISTSIFIEDRKGDDRLPSIRPNKARKGLRSLEVLKNDTGSMELISRLKKKGDAASTLAGLTPEQRALRAGMSKKDIEKLRRKAGKDVKGAFGILVEEQDSKSKGVEAVITPGTYDVWTGNVSSHDAKGKKKASVLINGGVGSWDEFKEKKDIQLPASFRHATKKTKSTALPLPKPGQSYNPAAEDHEALLNRAIEEMQKEEEQKKKELEWKKAWDMGAKEARGKGLDEVENLVGLKVGPGEVDDEEEGEGESDIESDDEDNGSSAAAKEIKRKTKQQKAKQKKLKEELRLRMNLKTSKRSLSDLQSLRSLKKQLIQMEKENLELAEKKRLARERRREERVGVYKVPKQQEEVQLGQDLAEGLRTLKPEGNLLKDRVHSFHKHGIVEPKKRDPIGKRKRGSMRGKKEYESHAYKRFS